MLALRTQSGEMVCVEGGSRHESMHPTGRSLRANRKDGCIERCVSASTSGTGACEGPGSERAGPRLVVTHRLSWVPHLGWRDRLYRVLRQHDHDLCMQDRSIFVQHRGEPNAPELGRAPGKLNHIAKSDGPREPARQSGER